MNTRIRLVGAMVIALALSLATARAQTDGGDSAQPADSAPGLLGRTYVGLTAGAFRIQNISTAKNPTGFAAGTELALPISDHFDYRLNFGYDDASKDDILVRDMQLDTSVAYYYRTKWISPFVSAGLGQDWARENDPATRSIQHYFLWDGGAGFEVPVAKSSAVRLGVNYDLGIAHPTLHRVEYDLKANHWFNDTIGTCLGATLRKASAGAHDAVTYVAGVQFSFD